MWPFPFRVWIQMVNFFEITRPCGINWVNLLQRSRWIVSISGTLLQNSDTVIPNPAPQKRTDITSFTILGLNTTKARQQEVVNAIIDVARRLMANQPLYPMPAYPGMPGYPSQPGYPTQPAYPGYTGMPGAPSPLIVNVPPASAPVITITNMMPPYQSSAYSSFMNSKQTKRFYLS